MSFNSIARTRSAGAVLRLAFALGGWTRTYVRERSLGKLHHLDDRLLRDIGLTRSDILRMRRHW